MGAGAETGAGIGAGRGAEFACGCCALSDDCEADGGKLEDGGILIEAPVSEVEPKLVFKLELPELLPAGGVGLGLAGGPEPREEP